MPPRIEEAPVPGPGVPELHSGDSMTQAEFHAIYEQMPEDFRAELIAGRVYVSSPLRANHGRNTPALTALLYLYKVKTPGVEVLENATVILGEDDEVQPDVFLRILPAYGGNSRLSAQGYIEGPPEFVIEAAHSSTSIDLNDKRTRYSTNGVLEYLVLNLRDQRWHWFDLQTGQQLQPEADGILRIRAFPGLWIHGAALLNGDDHQLLATLEQGLASPEHATFVAQLAAQKQ